MDYQLGRSKGKFTLSQGKNRVGTLFNSSKAAVNYVKNQKGESHKVFIGKGTEVTPELMVHLDKPKFIDTIRKAYPDVASVKFNGTKTTVKLVDGRVGVTVLHEGDTYSEELGFLYGYNNARHKAVKGIRIPSFPFPYGFAHFLG